MLTPLSWHASVRYLDTTAASATTTRRSGPSIAVTTRRTKSTPRAVARLAEAAGFERIQSNATPRYRARRTRHIGELKALLGLRPQPERNSDPRGRRGSADQFRRDAILGRARLEQAFTDGSRRRFLADASRQPSKARWTHAALLDPPTTFETTWHARTYRSKLPLTFETSLSGTNSDREIAYSLRLNTSLTVAPNGQPDWRLTTNRSR